MKTMTKSGMIGYVAGVSVALFVANAQASDGCASKTKAAACAAPKDIVDTAVSAGSFDTLAAALKAAGLVDALKGEGPFTVFAPTDDAFGKLPAGTVDSLLKDPPKLRQVLKYHVVSGKVTAADVVKLSSAKTLLGQALSIDASDGVKVNRATVVKTDIPASNGVIHAIDAVMLPKDDIVDVAAKAGSFKTLLAAVDAAELTDTLRGEGPFTLFAPTDEAFGKLPAGTVEGLLKDLPRLRSILKYHVVPGKLMAADVVKRSSATTVLGQSITLQTASPTKVDNATIVKTDIVGANGVIHVIDAVILPKHDIIDVAREAGSFKTLLAAIDAAGLADTLRDTGPFTVFAPTDEAFAKLPAGTIDKLLKDVPKLRQILLYHVVPGKLTAADVVKIDKARTAEGQSVHIDTSDGVKVNGARVIKADVPAANGVIHAIDAVILPQ
ncbi:MAG: fasciclin domain-containing protein [Phycisphaerae bacterium]|nr:fasciclin domain-containing protein [Phycisphaerae bacterium]